jgi:hypothetical protein
MWRRYGAGPRHLVAVAIALAFAAYGWVRIVQATSTAAITVVIWFVLAIVAHDLVLLPLYSGAHALARRLVGRRAVAYLAVPAAIIGFLVITWLPLIAGLGLYRFITTLSPDTYLARFGLIAAGLCVLAAVAWVVRRGRRG